MSIDKKRIGKILKVTAIGTGVTFLGLNMIAKKKKGDSVFEKEKDQKNPFAGKKVVFVEDESDEENADGVRGHLEAVGETKKSKDRKSTRLNSSHSRASRMPSSA